MSNNNQNHNDARRAPRGNGAPRRNRRRRQGVSLALVIVLLIMALLMGALGGYVVARRTDPHVHELQVARDRVTELENTLTLIGYPLGDDVDPQQWLYDSTANDNALEDLTGGAGWSEAGDDLWDDTSLLSSTLPEDTEPVVVAEFDGGTLLSSEVIPVYNDQLTTQIFAGHSADEVAQETLNSVLASMAGDKIIAAKAAELGLTELSDADLAEIQRQAEENYETQIADYIAFVGNGATREDAVRQLAEESGVTPESVAETLKANWWTQKFYDYIVRDVTVDDGDIQACYDALLARQKETFTAYPEEFEYAHQTGEVIVYRPEGYRAVRDILIAFSAEDAEAAARLADRLERDPGDAEAQTALNALYAPLEKTAQAVQDKLSGGADFVALMDEYGCDAALREEPLRSEGYYISDHSYLNSVEYVEGSMMLEQPGQVSAPLRSASGLHLVEYIGNVAPGEVPLAEITDAVRAEALRRKQADYYASQRAALLEAANVKYYPERLH